MRIATVVTLAAVLGLAACNREEAADPAMEADVAADAAATDSSGAMGSGSGPAAAPSDMGGTAAAPADGGAMSGSEPVDSMAGGVSDATRANAKEKAEQTNLHPAG